MLPSQEEISAALQYDPGTGIFVRKGNGGARFKRWKGKPAGGDNGSGYIRILVAGRSCFAHRLAWKLVYGTEPKHIDHINGRPSDNRIANLRVATHAQNISNSGKRVNNTSGFKGVSRDNSTRFRATITVQGRQIYLGSFVTPEAAYAAYCEAAQKLHGEFARLS